MVFGMRERERACRPPLHSFHCDLGADGRPFQSPSQGGLLAASRPHYRRHLFILVVLNAGEVHWLVGGRGNRGQSVENWKGWGQLWCQAVLELELAHRCI